MKNTIRKKITAGFMLLVFGLANPLPIAIASDMSIPVVRSQQPISALDINSDAQLQNGDSMVNLSLRDADIKQVLRMFADQAGMNIIFSSDVNGEVTMDLVNVTLSKALDLIMATNELAYRIHGNTLVIVSKDSEIDLGGTAKDIIILPVKYVSAKSIADFLNKNIFSKTGINFGVSTKPVASVNPALNELMIIGTREDAIIAQRIIEQFDKKPTIINFKVNHVTPAEMADLVCKSLIPSFMSPGGEDGAATGGAAGIPTGFASDSEAGDDGGGSSFDVGGGGGSGGGEGISIGGGTLACSIEQKTEGDEISSLPFKNLTVTYFPGQGTIQIIGGSETQIELIKDYIAANDLKSPQAYLEIQIIELSEAGSKTFDNTWKYVSSAFSFNADLPNGKLGTWDSAPIFFAGHGFTEAKVDADGKVISSEGYMRVHRPQNLTYAINYLIENRKARVLANPRILLTNGQESTIDLTSDYVSKVTSQYLDSTGTGSSQVQREYEIESDNGIKVTITPFISPDGYVTLDIKPEYATIGEKIYTGGEVSTQSDLVATLLQRRNLDLKGVRIKDGETLVIGGLIQQNEQKTVRKIPFLGDIPVVGALFRSTGTDKEKLEMIIMLTPQILLDTEDAENEEATL